MARQLPSFAAIGVVSTLAYLALYWLLRTQASAMAANAGALLRFILLRSWVFHPRRARRPPEGNRP
jgi:putative flippase GtrA